MAACFMMSLKPKFLDRILAGTKDYELRRSNVKFGTGDLVILYGSSPNKSIIGGFTVLRVDRGVPSELWKTYGDKLGVTHREFEDYFYRSTAGSAIAIRERVRVMPITLQELRDRFPGFRPPQSYARWKGDPVQVLGQKALDHLGWDPHL